MAGGDRGIRGRISARFDPSHPYHAAALAIVHQSMTSTNVEPPWCFYNFTIDLALPMLDDVSLTKTTYEVRDGKRLDVNYENGGGGGSLPDNLQDPAVRLDKVTARVCDLAGMNLSGMLVGAPDVHPLFKDNDRRLLALKQFIKQHRAHLRRMPFEWAEQAKFYGNGEADFYPDLIVAGWLARADDVAAGRAIFSLPTVGGHPDDRPLPMLAALNLGGGKTESVLVVQSEKDAAGKTHYGIIGRHQIRQAAAAELSDVKPMQ
jgi:hypothetical protein